MSGRTEPGLVVVTAAAPRVGAGAREAFARDLAANRPRGAVVVDTCHRVVGKDQILHQLRTAFGDARATGELPDTIDRAFQLALRTGRPARAWRDTMPRSMADVAVDDDGTHERAARRLFGL